MDTEIEYTVTVQGLVGKVIFNEYGAELHGKWASHTGYRSACACLERSDPSEIEAVMSARQSYQTHARYPYVVGEEHKEQGWRSIHINLDGRVEIRLPDWHEGTVAAVIESMGMGLTDQYNNYWSFAETVDMAEAKAALAPILQRGTRFTDERILAGALRRTGAAAGLRYPQEQLELAL